VVRGPIGAESVPALTQSYLRLNGHRPQYAVFNRFDEDSGGWSLRPEGPQYRLIPPGKSLAVDRALGLRHLALSSLRGFWERPQDPRTLTLIIGDRAIHENGLGLAAEELQRWDEAVASYRRAGALHPENPDYPFNRGNALYGQGRKKEAIAAFEEAVQLDPAYVNGWYNLGVTRYQTGDTEAAQAAFRRVLALDPSRSDVRALVRP